MKKILFLAILLFLTSTASKLYAQKREDEPSIKLDSVSADLANVKNWQFYAGKWHGDEAAPKYGNWATFQYNGEKYYMYICPRISGRYLYPALKQDYVPMYFTDFTVFTVKQFNTIIEKLNEKEGKNIFFKSITGNIVNSTVAATSKEAIGDMLLVTLNITMKAKKFGDIVFPMNSQVVEGQEVVRFKNPIPSYNARTTDLKNDYLEIPLSDFIAAMRFK